MTPTLFAQYVVFSEPPVSTLGLNSADQFPKGRQIQRLSRSLAIPHVPLPRLAQVLDVEAMDYFAGRNLALEMSNSFFFQILDRGR